MGRPAHDDAIDVPFPNRDLIDANHRRRWRARHVELRLHVQRVHRFHRLPIEPQILSHFRDRGAAALLADIQREPTRVVRILREPVETLLLHTTARAARHAPQGELQSHLHIAARQIADLSHPLIVPRAADRATDPADRCFWRRCRVTTTACGSASAPRTVRLGVKPTNRYASRNSRGLRCSKVLHELSRVPPVPQVRFSL